mmetsp:Transcript_66414/g.158926  ORF Transcript_66414/g.158926 Transcript_66414/m.158926 type:complete len:995 (-) Transcript_66414:133-3117(-)
MSSGPTDLQGLSREVSPSPDLHQQLLETLEQALVLREGVVDLSQQHELLVSRLKACASFLGDYNYGNTACQQAFGRETSRDEDDTQWRSAAWTKSRPSVTFGTTEITARESHPLSELFSSEASEGREDAHFRSEVGKQLLQPHRSYDTMFASVTENGGGGGSSLSLLSKGDTRSTNTQHLRMLSLKSTSAPRWRALHPHSTFMNLWDGIGAIALLLDSFTIPWFFAFYSRCADVDAVFYYSTFLPRFYWTMDIVVTSIKGHWTRDIRLERRIARTFRLYLQSWFLCDVILVTATWIFTWTARPHGSSSRSSSVSSAEWCALSASNARISKILLLAVLLLVLRHLRKFMVVYENTKVYMLRWQRYGKTFYLFANIGAITLAILFINHVVSCLWYAIGEHESDSGNSWSVRGSELGWSRQYFYATALHWSISQMTPGSMEVFPQSALERVYNIIVLVIGWIVAAALAGWVNSVMTGARLRIEERSRRFLQMQRFFLQEGVEHSLAMTVNMQVKAAQQRRSRIQFADIEDFALLRKGTRQELSVSIYGPLLRKNNFFHLLEVMDANVFGLVCNQDISIVTSQQGDIVFEEGLTGDSIMFVHDGVLQYAPGPHSLEWEWDPADSRLRLHPHAWCSEVALWIEWRYLGSMQALEISETIHISAAGLCKSARKSSGDVAMFVAELSKACSLTYRCANVSWSDLCLTVDYADILAATSKRARLHLGEVLLDPARGSMHSWTSSWLFAGGHPKSLELLDEIDKGECLVCLHGGEVVRMVFLVTLRLQRCSDDKFLVKLGEINPGSEKAKVSCMLPGTKRKEEEPAVTAIKRLLEDMKPLTDAAKINFERAEVHESKEFSGRFGVHTRYVKTRFRGSTTVTDYFPRTTVVNAVDSVPDLSSRCSNEVTFQPAASTKSTRSRTAQDRQMMAPQKLLRQAQELLLAAGSEVLLIPHAHGDGRDDVFIWVSDAEFLALQTTEAKQCLELFLCTLARNQEVNWMTSL